MPGTLHVHPVGDAVAHDASGSEPDCICGPTTHPVEQDDGSIGWLIVHHALDAREQREGDNHER